MDTVYVRNDRCVSMGPSVSCDGFIPNRKYRVQTHVHEDHMVGFDTSKGEQTILMTPATKSLLVAEKNADLPHRRNILEIDANGENCPHLLNSGLEIAFYPAGHMPGAVMPLVNVNGLGNVLYTSDFSWPLTLLPEPNTVDVLILDSTYGTKELCRNYDQSEAIESFVELVVEILKKDDLVIITGHRGRLQWAAQLLANYVNNEEASFIFSKSAFKCIQPYMDLRGFHMDAIAFNSSEARDIIRSDRQKVIFVESRDRREMDQVANSHKKRIFLSQYMVPRSEPIVERRDIYTVGITDHADFNETIELVNTIKPKTVICSNTNGGNSESLAEFIRSELNIPATHEEKDIARVWGGE